MYPGDGPNRTLDAKSHCIITTREYFKNVLVERQKSLFFMARPLSTHLFKIGSVK